MRAEEHAPTMKQKLWKIFPRAIALFVASSLHGSVTMTLSDDSTYAEYSPSFTAYLNGTQIINATGNDIIGIYSFNITPGGSPSLGTPFWTTCVSPDGLLDSLPHTYDQETFAQASPGINPPNWANPVGAPLAGIENANFMFAMFKGSIMNGTSGQAGTTADQGAALALAMYDALYNSTGYGQISGTGFTIPGLASASDVFADYTSDVNAFLGAANAANVTALGGTILRPDPNQSGSAQDMVFVGTPVPEPSTIIAGALLFLPFAASTLRILRRRRVETKTSLPVG